MTEHEPNSHRKKHSIPLENIVAPLVFIFGIAASIVAVRRFAGFPFWAAALLGSAGFVLIALGGLWLFNRKR
jgi:hypothetical protein